MSEIPGKQNMPSLRILVPTVCFKMDSAELPCVYKLYGWGDQWTHWARSEIISMSAVDVLNIYATTVPFV